MTIYAKLINENIIGNETKKIWEAMVTAKNVKISRT